MKVAACSNNIILSWLGDKMNKTNNFESVSFSSLEKAKGGSGDDPLGWVKETFVDPVVNWWKKLKATANLINSL